MHSRKNKAPEKASNEMFEDSYPACEPERIVEEYICEGDTFWHNDLGEPQGKVSGNNRLRNPILCKALSFSHRERQLLGIHGRYPTAYRSEDKQIQILTDQIMNCSTNLQKYAYLSTLYSTKREFFFRILLANVKALMPLLSMDICNSLVTSFDRLTGYSLGIAMYITMKDKGHVYEVLRNWPQRCVRCIQVSDGSNIAYLGDWGINVMSILMSKLQQNVVYGGIHPDYCLCVALDVGTDNPECLNNSLYMGLHEKRPSWSERVEFFEEFLQAALRLFGTRTIIQCKDFCQELILHQVKEYSGKHCIIDNDYHSITASALAGLMVANRVAKRSILDNVIIFYGSSSFNIGMARLYMAYIMREGLNAEEAKSRIWFCDRYGLIVENRTKHKVPKELMEFAQQHAEIQALDKAIDEIKPNVLIGDSCEKKAFSSDVLNALERSTEQPIIYVMSRSKTMLECTAEEAFVRTKGRCTFISSSELPSLKYANKLYQPSWCRNAYLAGGITMGVMLAGLKHVSNEIYWIAAEQLSHLVWPNDLALRNVYPPASKMVCVNLQIAKAVLGHAFRRQWATLYPEPENLTEYIKSKYYNTKYREPFSETYCTEGYQIGTTESHKYNKLNI